MNNPNQNKLLTGIFLLVVGGLMLMYKLGAPLPWWLFSWKMFLIALGLFIGLKHNFRNPSWIILIIVGSVFLIEDIGMVKNMRQFIFPMILIGLGVFFLINPNFNRHGWKKHGKWKNFDRKWKDDFERKWSEDTETINPVEDHENNDLSDSTTINSTTIFGGVKKTILSKVFKGGEIINVFGGTELNLMQADIQGKVVLDIVNIMGGTKLIIPSNWEIQSDTVSILGGVENKRHSSAEQIAKDKVIILQGVNLFGGIEIKSY